MNKIKHLLIVLTICIALAGLAVLLYLLDPTFISDAYRVTSMIIVVSWAFFIIPSMLFDVQIGNKIFRRQIPRACF